MVLWENRQHLKKTTTGTLYGRVDRVKGNKMTQGTSNRPPQGLRRQEEEAVTENQWEALNRPPKSWPWGKETMGTGSEQISHLGLFHSGSLLQVVPTGQTQLEAGAQAEVSLPGMERRVKGPGGANGG